MHWNSVWCNCKQQQIFGCDARERAEETSARRAIVQERHSTGSAPEGVDVGLSEAWSRVYSQIRIFKRYTKKRLVSSVKSLMKHAFAADTMGYGGQSSHAAGKRPSDVKKQNLKPGKPAILTGRAAALASPASPPAWQARPSPSQPEQRLEQLPEILGTHRPLGLPDIAAGACHKQTRRIVTTHHFATLNIAVFCSGLSCLFISAAITVKQYKGMTCPLAAEAHMNSPRQQQQTQNPPLRYPPSIPFIIGTEAAERFSYYGMRSILTTYLVMQFFNPTHDAALQVGAEAAANAKTHLFVSLAYFMPVVGALLADTLFGRYRVILYVSMLYCLGHLCLAVFDTQLDGFSFGLLLLAIGAGGIKANVSAFVGEQFGQQQSPLISKAYGWFYFSINAGAMISMTLCPWLLNHYGAKVAFGVPGLFMLLATVIFYSGRHRYRHQIPTRASLSFSMLRKDLKSAGRVLLVFAFIPFFWAIWDQNESEWVLQAARLDLQLWPGLTLLPAQVQTANPVLVLLLIPVFTYFVYPTLARLGISPTPLRKIGAGLFMTAVSLSVIAWLQIQIDAGQSPSVWWQLLAYLLLTIAEVLVSITGLEYAYTNAPASLKSVMTSLWLLTVSVGNLMVSAINQSISDHGFFADYTGAAFYWFFVKMMVVVVIVFALTARFIDQRPLQENL